MDKFENGRVPVNTGEAIKLFVEKIDKQEEYKRFDMQQLVSFVEQYNFGTSPDSIKRTLRKLRTAGVFNYAVVNLKLGIFQLIPLEKQLAGN